MSAPAPEGATVSERVDAVFYKKDIPHHGVDEKKDDEYPHVNEPNLEYPVLAAQERDKCAKVKICHGKHKNEHAYILPRRIGKAQVKQ